MKILTAITGTPSTLVLTTPPQQTTILNTTNPRYPRTIILSTQAVRVTHGSITAGITISDLIAAMVALEPTLTWPPVIATQPVNIGPLVLPASTTFSVIATSETGISQSYQWYYSTNGGLSFAVVPASSPFFQPLTANLGITDVTGLHNYQFYCIITNASGSTQTNTVTLFVDPDITAEPAPVTVTAPAPASFSVTGYTATTIAYQWQLSTNSGVSWSNLTNAGVYSGVTTASLAISNSTGLNGNLYRVTLTNANGTSTSNSAALTVH